MNHPEKPIVQIQIRHKWKGETRDVFWIPGAGNTSMLAAFLQHGVKNWRALLGNELGVTRDRLFQEMGLSEAAARKRMRYLKRNPYRT